MIKNLISGKKYKIKSFEQLCAEYKSYRSPYYFNLYKTKFEQIAEKELTILNQSLTHSIYRDLQGNVYNPYYTKELPAKYVIYYFEIDFEIKDDTINIF